MKLTDWVNTTIACFIFGTCAFSSTATAAVSKPAAPLSPVALPSTVPVHAPFNTCTEAIIPADAPTILFIDLNKRPELANAIQGAAKCRGENYLVYPSVGMSYKFGIDEVKLVFDDLEKKQVKLSSIVIGSHDGNEEFWGIYQGSFNSDEFLTVITGHPVVTKDLKSLYLWGCYTGARGSIRGLFLDQLEGKVCEDQNGKHLLERKKSVFSAGNRPVIHLDVIAGFGEGAPALTKVPNQLLLYDAMRSEKALLATSMADPNLLLKQLRVIHSDFAGAAFTEMVGTYFYQRKLTSLCAIPDVKECEDAFRGTQGIELNNFLLAQKSEEGDHTDIADDGPEGTDATARQIYNYFAGLDCSYLPAYPNLAVLRMVTFYNHYRKAIIKAHAGELTRMNILLSKLMIPGLSAIELSGINRHTAGATGYLSHHALLERMKVIGGSLGIQLVKNPTDPVALEAQMLWRGFYQLISFGDTPSGHKASREELESIFPTHWLEAGDITPYPPGQFRSSVFGPIKIY